MHDVVTPGDVSSQVVAYLYFGSFVVLGQFMMINLFVAVILENFEREFASSSVSKVRARAGGAEPRLARALSAHM